MIRIIMADDHALVRGGIRQLLALAPTCSWSPKSPAGQNSRNSLLQQRAMCFYLICRCQDSPDLP